MIKTVFILAWFCAGPPDGGGGLPGDAGGMPGVVSGDAGVSDALRRAGIDPAAVRLAPEDVRLIHAQRGGTPLLEWMFASPLKIPSLGPYVRDAFKIQWPGDCVGALGQLSRWRGHVVRRGLVGDALEGPKKAASGRAPVVAALERVFRLGGRPMDGATRKKAARQLKGASDAERSRLAVLLQAMCDAQEWAQLAADIRTPDEWAAVLARERKSEDKEGSKDERPARVQFLELKRSADLIRDFDAALPLVGAEEIAFAVDEFVAPYVRREITAKQQPKPFSATDRRAGEPENAGTMNVDQPETDEPKPGPSSWSLVLDTPLGLISIGSEHDLSDQTMAPFLLVDWDGDDEYPRLAANTPPVQRVSVALDLGGNDRYVNTESPYGGFGAGHAGIGMLFDFAGDDTYTIDRNGLGQALFGVGVLFDADGDDRYEAVEKAQAVATCGTALLIDIAGADKYEIYNQGQGFGGPRGAAALVDLDGSDRYKANDVDIRFPSPQSAEHNVSLAQGAASGWRGDYLQGLSVAGGVGLLLDGGGNDIYYCGVFGQGVGYWYGTGLLLDAGGSDQYTGQWYVQGAGAHFAAGVLLDSDGDDAFTGTMNMTQGAGHDLSLGALFDLSGNDRHRAGTLSLGAGNAGGLGLMIDWKGTDSYVVKGGAGSALGYVTPERTQAIRRVIQGFGLFIDLDGMDGYSATRASNDAVWTAAVETPAGVLPGIARGIDTHPVAPKPPAEKPAVPKP